jgi:WD40 repeat protein
LLALNFFFAPQKLSRCFENKTMRLQCPQVTWHGGEQGKNAPILSIDFHPTDRHLIATGGADGEARVKERRRSPIRGPG